MNECETVNCNLTNFSLVQSEGPVVQDRPQICEGSSDKAKKKTATTTKKKKASGTTTIKDKPRKQRTSNVTKNSVATTVTVAGGNNDISTGIPQQINQEAETREVISGFTEKRCLTVGYGCKHYSMQVMQVLDDKGYFESYRDGGKGFFYNTSCAKCGKASSSMNWSQDKEKKTNRIIYYCQTGGLSSVETENGKYCPWWCIPCGDELKEEEGRVHDEQNGQAIGVASKRSRRLAAGP
jgi:ribosomal protein S25